MKKLIKISLTVAIYLGFLFCLYLEVFGLPQFAFSKVYTANQQTVAWDPIVWDETIEPICDGTTYPCSKIGVHVYIRQKGKTPLLVQPSDVAEIYEQNQITISFQQEGEWAIGICSVRNTYSDANTLVQTIINPVYNWSDEANPDNPEQFTVMYWEVPLTVKNLHRVTN